MHYISINLYRKMINHALVEGMERSDFINLPTPIDLIGQIQAVPADHFFGLHEFLDERLGPGFSVRVGGEMKIDDYGVLGLSWRTCARAVEIYERCERYFRMLSDTYVFKVEVEGDLSHVYLNRDTYRRGVELSNEATFSATVVVLKAMTETDISPIEVSFNHSAPRGLADYKAAFQCPVSFDQPYTRITYLTTALETRTAKADASINRFLLERVEEETKGMEISPGKVVLDVKALITDALPSGIPSVAQIGTHMGMSSRTLTRRLSEHGLTFRTLITEIQQEVSQTLLTQSASSMAEIAF